jgi:hypothetical protein
MSLGEEEAFPITAAEIQAPRLPPDVKEDTGRAPRLPDKRPYRLVAIAFVIVAVFGALAAVKFYVAASHDAATQE